jgi:hypothetical protein
MTASGAADRLTGAWRRQDPGLVRLTRAAGGVVILLLAEGVVQLAAMLGYVTLSPVVEMAAGLAAIITHVMVKWPLRRDAVRWHAAVFAVLLATQAVPSLGQGYPRLLDALLLAAVFAGISARRLGEPFTTAGVGMLIAFLSSLFSPVPPAMLPEVLAMTAVGWAIALAMRAILPPPSPRLALGDQLAACRVAIREVVAALPALLEAPAAPEASARAHRRLKRLTRARLALTTLAGTGEFAEIGRQVALQVHDIETSLVIAVEVIGLESIMTVHRPQAWPPLLKAALADTIAALDAHLAARGTAADWLATRERNGEWLVEVTGGDDTEAGWFFRAARVLSALARTGEAAALAHEALS